MPLDSSVLERQLASPDLNARLFDRWWERLPWFFPRCHVRILIYVDSTIFINGGSFKGMQEVLKTLATSPWYWVQFDVTTVHREDAGGASGATLEGKTFDQLNLSANYDEIWLFGFAGLPSYLSPAERTAIHSFMDTGGGVLVTGDHEALGAGLASDIKRAGKMRLWDPNSTDPAMRAPSASGADRHETLRSGHDNIYSFDDQSDDVPQDIRLRRYPLWGFPWWWRFRSAPHPVLCGPMGPIDVLPDHMHEGSVVVPAAFPANEWPSSSGGVQPKPEVIAWGRVLSEDPTSVTAPDAGNGRPNPTEFGVIGAYNGHIADVGRVVADSTWHHWFDINLNGEPGNNTPGDPKATGFYSSASGLVTLEKIKAYYRNVAVWLAPPALQRCMSHRFFWGAIYLDPLVMISPKIPILQLGAIARDAFGKYAPQCTMYDWIIHLVSPEILAALSKLLGEDVPALHRLPDLILGNIVRELRERFPRPELPNEPPQLAAVEAAVADAGRQGLNAALTLHDEQVRRVGAVLKSANSIQASVSKKNRPVSKPKAKSRRPSRTKLH